MPKWYDYEKLIEKIYRELEPNATVTHNDKIMGRNSGILRQIDVSIKAKVAGQIIVIIVQAKDYKTPVDVNTVGEFSSVIQDVGASKGVLICSSGFTESAKRFGKSLEIDLCNAVDVESINWKQEVKVPVVWIQRLPMLTPNFEVQLEAGDLISMNVCEWIFSSDGGITVKSLSQKFQKDGIQVVFLRMLEGL